MKRLLVLAGVLFACSSLKAVEVQIIPAAVGIRVYPYGGYYAAPPYCPPGYYYGPYYGYGPGCYYGAPYGPGYYRGPYHRYYRYHRWH